MNELNKIKSLLEELSLRLDEARTILESIGITTKNMSASELIKTIRVVDSLYATIKKYDNKEVTCEKQE